LAAGRSLAVNTFSESVAHFIRGFLLGGTKFLGIGTTWKYYAEEGDSYNDITPIRSTTSAGDVTFAATDGSSIITISDTAHGAVTNDFVTFSGATTLGGVITDIVLNQEYQILLVTTADAYQITAKDTTGATVVANSSDSWKRRFEHRWHLSN
jgi:hypothetical protein